MQFNRLELSTFLTAGNKGNTGGGVGATAVYGQNIYADALAEFFIRPDPLDPTAYQNGYWYKQLGTQNMSTDFAQELELYVPSTAKPQAIEFELQQQIKGLVFNFAWQILPDGTLRKFNFGANYKPGDATITGAWVPIGNVGPLAPDMWHKISTTTQRTDDLQTTHISFVLDGLSKISAATVYPAFRVPEAKLPNYADKFNVGFQLDMNPANGAYSVFVRNFNVTAL